MSGIFKTIYLASPLGFSELGQKGLKPIKLKLVALGHTVIDPWDTDVSQMVITATLPSKEYQQVKANSKAVALAIGLTNAAQIDKADCVLAVLDGQELDSGTVSELGYAVGRGKTVYGYRGDFRDLGELPGVPFNLQVYYFITASGGAVFRSIEEIKI